MIFKKLFFSSNRTIGQKNILRFFSNSNISNPNYGECVVSEIRIPHGNDNRWIAGKLWTCQNEDIIEPTEKILCLHGYMDNASSFDTLIPKIIKPGKEIFSLDFLGHGYSSHSNSYYNVWVEGLSSTFRILKHFNWDKVTLLGHSMGSMIAFAFASTFPELVNKYVGIECIKPFPPRDFHFPPNVRDSVEGLYDLEQKLKNTPPPLYTYEDLLARYYKGRKHTVSFEGCKILLKRASKKMNENEDKYTWSHDLKLRFMNGYGLFPPETVLEMAKRSKTPTCFIKAEPGSDYEPRENLLEFLEFCKKHNPNFEVHFVNGTHQIHLNSPQLVSPIINEFLEKYKI